MISNSNAFVVSPKTFTFSMLRRIVVFLVLTIFTVLFSQSDYPIDEYGDRLEGIVSDKTELVAGEQLTLLCAMIENKETISSPLPRCYQLAFFLDQPASLNVDVIEHENLYLMHPLEEEYKQGLNTFAWPSTIPLHFDISINALSAVAELYTEPNTIVPVFLHADNPVIESLKYNFCFHTANTIERLDYNIYHTDSKKLIYKDQLFDLDFGQNFYIHWSGCGNDKTMQQSGWYFLNISAHPSNGDVVNLKFKFYHHQNFAELGSLNPILCNP